MSYDNYAYAMRCWRYDLLATGQTCVGSDYATAHSGVVRTIDCLKQGKATGVEDIEKVYQARGLPGSCFLGVAESRI